MTGFLLSEAFLAGFGETFSAAAREVGLEPHVVRLPDDAKARLTPEDCARIEVAYVSRDWRLSRRLRERAARQRGRLRSLSGLSPTEC